MTNEVLPAIDTTGAEGLDARASTPPPRRRARPSRHRCPRFPGRRRPRQGLLDHRRRGDRAIGLVCHDFRRADRPRHHAAHAVSARRRRRPSTCPRLVSGEIVGAYALSESGSGSDALGAKARATSDARRKLRPQRREDVDHQRRIRRHLHRLRQSRTASSSPPSSSNAAFPGVSNGKEEHKMGLHGSSTTPLILQDAQVPAGNVLGEIGKGHKVAFNVLNYGRFKLAAMCSGGARAHRRRSGDVRRCSGSSSASRSPQLRRDQTQARRDGDPRVRRREHAVPDGRPDRRGASTDTRTAAAERRGHARGARGVRHRSVDPQGRRQRDDRLRRRRERADPRRQRLRARLPGRAARIATPGSIASSRGPTRSTGC